MPQENRNRKVIEASNYYIFDMYVRLLYNNVIIPFSWPLHADCTFDFSDAYGKEVWKLTPRSLKSQTALKLVQLGNPDIITPGDLPASIFPTLFTEACRY